MANILGDYPPRSLIDSGGLLAIHASLNCAEFYETRDMLRREFKIPVPELEELPRGVIVGVARLTGFTWQFTQSSSRWAARGQCHWQLADARLLVKPVAERGRQRLWRYQPAMQGELM